MLFCWQRRPPVFQFCRFRSQRGTRSARSVLRAERASFPCAQFAQVLHSHGLEFLQSLQSNPSSWHVCHIHLIMYKCNAYFRWSSFYCQNPCVRTNIEIIALAAGSEIQIQQLLQFFEGMLAVVRFARVGRG